MRNKNCLNAKQKLLKCRTKIAGGGGGESKVRFRLLRHLPEQIVIAQKL